MPSRLWLHTHSGYGPSPVGPEQLAQGLQPCSRKVSVAARPGAWPAGPAEEETSVGEVEQADLARSDWWGAEQRRLGSTGAPLPRSQLGSAEWANAASSAPLSRGTVGTGAVVTGSVGRGTAATLAVPSPAESGSAAGSAVVTGPRRRRVWIPLTRLWATAPKVASMAYTTWPGNGLRARRRRYDGVGLRSVCLFAGFGACGGKCFLAGSSRTEPELYEEIGLLVVPSRRGPRAHRGAAVTAQYL